MKRVVLMTAATAAIGVAMADFVPTREIGWYQTSIPSYVAGTDLTNQTETVTNTYSGQVVYTPPPPWKLASEGWVTNTTTTTTTRLIDRFRNPFENIGDRLNPTEAAEPQQPQQPEQPPADPPNAFEDENHNEEPLENSVFTDN